MSLGGKPKSPKLPKEPEPIEEIQTIAEDATDAEESERRRVLSKSGRQSTLMAGIANALKTRLG